MPFIWPEWLTPRLTAGCQAAFQRNADADAVAYSNFSCSFGILRSNSYGNYVKIAFRWPRLFQALALARPHLAVTAVNAFRLISFAVGRLAIGCQLQLTAARRGHGPGRARPFGCFRVAVAHLEAGSQLAARKCVSLFVCHSRT